MRTVRTILIFTNFLFPQSFGQNKVQYDSFDWEYIVSPNTNIYYYGDNEELAIFTSKVAERSIEQIGKHLRWRSDKPIKIIVYTSHNDFQQTNVVNVYMSEGIGGVTELYKNRIVIPFEGSYEQFEHVIHHELVHAAINQLVYGGNAQGLISGRIRVQVPLWANEGLAEFLSVDWDTNSDMVLRDLAIEDRLPSIPELNYSILAYKGGQSVWQYITQKYGREKVGEIFQQMKRAQNDEKGFESALGVDYEKLTDDWHDFVKREYWPDLVNRENFDDFSTKITDRTQTRNFYNVSPSFSPDGNTIAYFSDQDGYMDLILYEVDSEKQKQRLIRGNTTPDLEELKWLQPGISWSADGKSISFASKSGEQDSIIIVDVKTGKYEKIPIDLDGVFTTSWHPFENKIAFMGHKDDSSDIYIIDLNSDEIINITNDIFSDSSPSWSPNGKIIYFTSDRGENINANNKSALLERCYIYNGFSIFSSLFYEGDLDIFNYVPPNSYEATRQNAQLDKLDFLPQTKSRMKKSNFSINLNNINEIFSVKNKHDYIFIPNVLHHYPNPFDLYSLNIPIFISSNSLLSCFSIS